MVLAACALGGCRSGVTTTNRFEKADLNRDGLITQPEAGVYIASHLFDGMDKNHDARINSAEWNAGGDMMTARNFQKADTNHDGVVTEDELKVAAIHSKKLSDFMAGADANHDGGISKPEALNYYASKEGPVN
jgi:hypothetical protein